MKQTDEERLKKIFEYGTELQKYIKENNVSREAVLTDIHLQWLITTPLYNIGEHVYYLSPEFKKEHEDIEWDLIAGLRHRLVHDYDGTNWNIIADAIFYEVPTLLDEVGKLI